VHHPHPKEFIMPDLQHGETAEMKGSGAKPYILKNVAGVYSCTCPAWRNQSLPIEQRTCKHLRKYRGDDAEEARVGNALPMPRKQKNESGEEIAGPEVLLAEKWDNSQDLTGWWMSEKLDGIRAYWDGKQILSRKGNILFAPDWFVAGLPPTPLDGELWVDRKKFNVAQSIVMQQSSSPEWRQVKYLVFDAPAMDLPFEDRYAAIIELFRAAPHPHAQALMHELCRGVDHLREELARVEAMGGEGLMMRKPGSKYERSRSTTLLKVKTFHDAEAVVIGHEGGAGRHKGRMGSLRCRLPDGNVFFVGTGFSDVQRENPPAIGSTITFRYQEFTEGNVPRFPSFVRVRTDTVSPPPPPPLPAVIAATGKRRFENTEGGASKFWEVSVSGNEMTTAYGKIGSAARSTTKTFKDATAAQTAAAKLVTEKTGDGYVEVTATP